MKHHFSACPSCNSTQTKKLGPIPIAFHFCSHQFEKPINPGSLFRCGDCGLHFRSPCLTETELIALYSSIEGKLWSNASGLPGTRNDFLEIDKYLASSCFQGTNLCDVGCFSGDLLLFLNDNCQTTGQRLNLFGVEPSREASALAASRGIQILGSTAADISSSNLRFDAIFCVDVFEHVSNPRLLMEQCAASLRKGGLLILVTGAIDSPFLKFWRGWSYYVAMPEHIVFLSKTYAKSLTEFGLDLLHYNIFRRRDPSFRSSLNAFVRNSAFLLIAALNCTWLSRWINTSRKLKSISSRGVSSIHGAQDHVIACFSKR